MNFSYFRNGMGLTACLAIVLALPVAGCGGGGGGEVSVASVSQLDYSNTAAPRHSYAPYQTRSHVYTWSGGPEVREVYIGGDLEPREALRHVLTENGIRYFMGATRDGVGVGRLKNYEHDLITQNEADPYGWDGHGFMPFIIAPLMYLDQELLAPENAGILRALIDSVLIVNDALPPEFQIEIAGAIPNPTVAFTGTIVVNLEAAATIGSICSAGAVACARNSFNTISDYTRSSILHVPDDLDTSGLMYPRSVILHELLHALGIWGHVDSVEFPDSIMGAAGEYIPNPGHVISKIDREVLQIMYMSQETEIYNDWGEWSDTSFHLVGRAEDGDLNFGVALFNGLPQPWVRGTRPDTILADNTELTGTATWSGSLLGFSGPSPLAGNAELQVGLSTLGDPDNEQDLHFRDIYYVNRFESSGEDRWFHTRDIDYKVSINGNWFQNVRREGYEQGFVTGSFLGREHEHMGGTVKRTDMIAAFGGTR